MFNIVVITPETDHPHEERILHALVRAHNITIHVRKPDFTEDAYNVYLTKYSSIHSHMVLHEHHALANFFSVKGIHLKESDRKSVTQTINDVKIISTGFHSIDDVKKFSQKLEYVFFSPLFKSISKEDYGTNHTIEDLSEMVLKLKEQTSTPIIGLGGINEENIALVKKSGFDGAALLGAVWNSTNPVASFEKIISSGRQR